MKTKVKALIFFCVVLTFCVALTRTVSVHAPTVSYTQFLDEVRSGRISNATIAGNSSGPVRATGRLNHGGTIETVLPADYRDALEAMLDETVDVEIKPSSASWANAVPFLALAGLWVVLLFVLRRRTLPL